MAQTCTKKLDSNIYDDKLDLQGRFGAQNLLLLNLRKQNNQLTGRTIFQNHASRAMELLFISWAQAHTIAWAQSNVSMPLSENEKAELLALNASIVQEIRDLEKENKELEDAHTQRPHPPVAHAHEQIEERSWALEKTLPMTMFIPLIPTPMAYPRW